MGNTLSEDIALNEKELEELRDMTGFTFKQIKKLYKRFQTLDKDGSGTITIDEFYSIPELVTLPLHSRVIMLFAEDNSTDIEKIEVNFTQFIKTLSVFTPSGSKEDKLEAAFKIYDINGDGVISADELFALVSLMVGDSISEKDKQYIVDKIIEECDETGDQTITFSEFKNALEDIDVEKKLFISF